MHFTTLTLATLATTALASHPHRHRQVQAEINYFSCDGSLATPLCCDETESTSGVCDKANVVGTVENIDVSSCELYQGKSTYAWCCGEYLSSPVSAELLRWATDGLLMFEVVSVQFDW